MISTALAVTLLLTGAPADGTPAARKAYSACLQKFIVKGLDEKLEAAAFDTAIAAACPAESNALRQAAVGAYLGAGRKRADAEEMVEGDMSDYQANAKDMFREYKEHGGRPEI